MNVPASAISNKVNAQAAADAAKKASEAVAKEAQLKAKQAAEAAKKATKSGNPDDKKKADEKTKNAGKSTSAARDGLMRAIKEGKKWAKTVRGIKESKTPKAPINPWLSFSISVRIAGLFRSTTVISLLNEEYFFNLDKVFSS